MSDTILYDEIWMRGYLNRLREERALINEIIYLLGVARYSVDINCLPNLFSIAHELEQVKDGISKTIDALEEYQYSADYAAQVLQNAMLQIELPSLLK